MFSRFMQISTTKSILSGIGISTGSSSGYLQQPSRPLLSSQGRSLTQNEFGGLGGQRSSSRFTPTSSAFRPFQV